MVGYSSKHKPKRFRSSLLIIGKRSISKCTNRDDVLFSAAYMFPQTMHIYNSAKNKVLNDELNEE